MEKQSVPHFNQMVRLSNIIGSEFYHRYPFLTATARDLSEANKKHGSLPKNLTTLDLYHFNGNIHYFIQNLEKISVINFCDSSFNCLRKVFFADKNDKIITIDNFTLDLDLFPVNVKHISFRNKNISISWTRD